MLKIVCDDGDGGVVEVSKDDTFVDVRRLIQQDLDADQLPFGVWDKQVDYFLVVTLMSVETPTEG